MNKLLGVSIAAMLAVTPMMANATAVNARGVSLVDDGSVSNSTNVATTSYVKGAYNALATEVNYIASDIDIASNGNNLSTSKTIAENVADLDAAMGDVDELAGNTVTPSSTLTNITWTNNQKDLTKAVIAINNALATTTGDAKVGTGTYNYVVANATGASNLVRLDTAMGKQESGGNYIGATVGDDPTTLSANIAALDTAVGTTDDGTIVKAIGTTSGKKTVAQNLKDLDTQVELNRAAIATLNGDGTAGSVKKTVIDNAASGTFTATANGLSNGTLAQAINQVQTNLNNANTDATLLQGHYYEYQTHDNVTKDTVAGAIQKVDAQVYANKNAIDAINAKRIGLFGNWSNPDAATASILIGDLTATNPVQ